MSDTETKTNGDKYVCDEPGCERIFDTKQMLGMHRWHAHGIPGTSHAAQTRTRKKTAPKKPSEPRPPKPIQLSADDVIETVLEALFPRGQVSVRHVQAVAVWCQHTKDFIAELDS